MGIQYLPRSFTDHSVFLFVHTVETMFSRLAILAVVAVALTQAQNGCLNKADFGPQMTMIVETAKQCDAKGFAKGTKEHRGCMLKRMGFVDEAGAVDAGEWKKQPFGDDYKIADA